MTENRKRAELPKVVASNPRTEESDKYEDYLPRRPGFFRVVLGAINDEIPDLGPLTFWRRRPPAIADETPRPPGMSRRLRDAVTLPGRAPTIDEADAESRPAAPPGPLRLLWLSFVDSLSGSRERPVEALAPDAPPKPGLLRVVGGAIADAIPGFGLLAGNRAVVGEAEAAPARPGMFRVAAASFVDGLPLLGDRRPVFLAAALPFMAATAYAGLVVWDRPGPRELAAVYRREADSAERRGDDRSARFLRARLADLDGSPDALFRLASVHDRLGETAEAERLMSQLVEGGGPGHPGARRWLADRVLDDPAAARDPRRLAEARKHLTAAVRADSEDAETRLKLARLLIAVGDAGEALRHYERLVIDDPTVWSELATAYSRAGQSDAARTAAERSETELRRRLAQVPGDRDARLRLAGSLAGLGRFEEATVVLEEGARLSPSDDYGPALARSSLLHYNALASAGASAAERLPVARKAFESDPTFEACLVALSRIAAEPGADSAAAAEAKRIVEGALAAGRDSASVRYELGVAAFQAGDLAGARTHLERAHALDPGHAHAANNLAWLLATQAEPDLGRAQRIADSAVKAQPSEASFRDTRGMILAKLGRWSEALTDLELAVGALGNSAETRRLLAEAYRRAGRPGLAAAQEKAAAAIEAKGADADVPPGRP